MCARESAYEGGQRPAAVVRPVGMHVRDCPNPAHARRPICCLTVCTASARKNRSSPRCQLYQRSAEDAKDCGNRPTATRPSRRSASLGAVKHDQEVDELSAEIPAHELAERRCARWGGVRLERCLHSPGRVLETESTREGHASPRAPVSSMNAGRPSSVRSNSIMNSPDHDAASTNASHRASSARGSRRDRQALEPDPRGFIIRTRSWLLTAWMAPSSASPKTPSPRPRNTSWTRAGCPPASRGARRHIVSCGAELRRRTHEPVTDLRDRKRPLDDHREFRSQEVARRRRRCLVCRSPRVRQARAGSACPAQARAGRRSARR